jgi:hypothetical protein
MQLPPLTKGSSNMHSRFRDHKDFVGIVAGTWRDNIHRASFTSSRSPLTRAAIIAWAVPYGIVSAL